MAIVFHEKSWLAVETGMEIMSLDGWANEAPEAKVLMGLEKSELWKLNQRGQINIEKKQGGAKKMQECGKDEIVDTLISNWSRVLSGQEGSSSGASSSIPYTLQAVLKKLTKTQLLAILDTLKVKKCMDANGKDVPVGIKLTNEALAAAITKAKDAEVIVNNWLVDNGKQTITTEICFKLM